MEGRMIPKSTKVKTQFFKGLNFSDILVVLFALIIVALAMTSGFDMIPKLVISGITVFITIVLFMSFEPGVRLYKQVGDLFKYFFGVNSYKRMKGNGGKKNVKNLLPYVGILEQEYDEKRQIGIIDYKEYFGAAIELNSIQFYMLSESRQNTYIETLESAFKTISPDDLGAIYKFARPMVFDNYIDNECKKREEILDGVRNGTTNINEARPRLEIAEARINNLESMNVDSEFPVYKDHMYLAFFCSNIKNLLQVVNFVSSTIESGSGGAMECKILDRKQTAIFLKSYYTNNFDEREVKNIDPKNLMDWIAPDKVTFGLNKISIDGQQFSLFELSEYPLAVPNAWGRTFFSVPGARICVKFKPVEQAVSEKRLDRSIMDVRLQASEGSKKASSSLEVQTHLETLTKLLQYIKQGSEMLLDTNIYMMVEQEQKKAFRTQVMRAGFRVYDLFGKQKEAFTNTNVSRRMTIKKYERGINSSSLAAIFPFVSDAIQDPKGFYVGMNSEPVFLDFFQRDKERINSNMVIMGKSGCGKSFCTKSLLANLAADNSKIFILDPEKEYDIIAKNMYGKVIDVGSAREGRINPLQVNASQDDEDSATGGNVSLAMHMQFLETFFGMILEGITMDGMELLNGALKELYNKFGINNSTQIENVKPEQFPIMQDLYDYICELHDNATDDYNRNNYKILKIYLNKFAEGGRNAVLWNGPSTISSAENFIVFNFQSLLANNAGAVANAQMLLIMRWLNNEVINNKDYNAKYHCKRKVIVVIDEAHVFIDPKQTIALDFMQQMAKRIRKYEGSQIVITQNIKDFTGSPEIARKSTAIINACQYSLIFSLAPQDISDLVLLYEKAGKINEKEQDTIVTNPRGRAFVMTSPYSRTNVDILVNDRVRNLFEKLRDDVK
jgi:hypothetical protein